MQPPILGTWQARILAVKPFTIHSDEYFELTIERIDANEADNASINLRAPSHAFTAVPAIGQCVVITFLMGQVTKVEASR